MVRVAAFSRTGDPEQQRFARQRAYLEKTFGAQVTVVENPHVVDISSTRLRQLLPGGQGVPAGGRCTATSCASGSTAPMRS